MNIEVLRKLPVGGDMVELLIRVDGEFMDVYYEETGDAKFDQGSFDRWMTERLEMSIEGEDWKYED